MSLVPYSPAKPGLFKRDLKNESIVLLLTNETLPRPVAFACDIYSLPEISSTATSSEFSDKSVYPYFSRVVPSDDAQVMRERVIQKERESERKRK